MKPSIIPLFSLLLLAGCSGTPVLKSDGAGTTPSARQVAEGNTVPVGKRVLWGGVIVNSSNLKERTRLEVLAYPLGDNQRPQTERTAGHRFFAYNPGYLETVDYAAGRQVSLVGKVRDIETAPLGEHPYRYPVIDIEQLHLWPIEPAQSEPKVRFGIGIMFHN